MKIMTWIASVIGMFVFALSIAFAKTAATKPVAVKPDAKMEAKAEAKPSQIETATFAAGCSEVVADSAFPPPDSLLLGDAALPPPASGDADDFLPSFP